MKSVKQILLTAILTMMAATTFAYDVKVDGIYYNLNTTARTAEVTYQSLGEGGYSGNVTIPASFVSGGKTYSVTSIGDSAFGVCTGLTAITIPNSVTSIGYGAFQSCSGLTAITIPNSVTSIGGIAFYGCTGLTDITIPNSVTSIGGTAFAYCTGFTAIVVDESNPTYDSRENCNAIVETASNSLIIGCRNTTIPNSVTSIEERAFYGCTGLTAITIPESVTSIGNGVFYDCSDLTAITIPNSVTSIGYGAFQSCSGLTAITIPNSVTSIGCNTFWYCRGLTDITIPNSVTSIEERAFYGCTGLTAITIPESVTSIGYGAFEYCNALSKVYCYAETVPQTSPITFYDSPIEQAALYVPASALTAYQSTAPWSDFGTIEAIDPASINPTPMRGITVQSVHGFVTITGLAEYEHISYYSTAGAYLGTAESIDGTATFTAPANTIVVVKIGTRSIKVNVR